MAQAAATCRATPIHSSGRTQDSDVVRGTAKILAKRNIKPGEEITTTTARPLR